jgi:hypothetical protein
MPLVHVLAQQSVDVTSRGGGGAASLGFICVFGLIGLAAFAFWIWMLIDAISNLPSGNEKIVWVLVIVFTGIIGALIYFFVGRKRPLA